MAISAIRLPDTRTSAAGGGVFFIILAALPFIAVTAPRLAGYLPAAAGVAFLLYGFFFLKERPAFPRSLILWIAALLSLAGLSVLWAIDPAAALRRTLKAAPLLLGGAALYAAATGPRADAGRQHLWLIPACYAVAAIFLAAELWLDMPLYRLTHGLAWADHVKLSRLNRSMVFCTLLYAPVMALLVSLRADDSRRMILAFAITIPLLLALARTASQTTLFSFAAGALFTIFFPCRLKSAWIVLGMLVAGAVLAAPWLSIFLFSHAAEHVQSLPMMGRGGAFAANRLEVWDYVSRYALQQPFYGFGIEATRAVTAFDSAQIYQPGLTILHPHNFAVQLWMEFGLIGALLGAGLLTHILWMIYRSGSAAAQRAGLAAFIACLAAASVSYGLWQGWWLGLLTLVHALTAMAMRSLASREKDG